MSHKRALKTAVLTSTLLGFVTPALAVVNITTDLSAPVTIDASDAAATGTKDTNIKASGGSILVTGVNNAVLFTPSGTGDTGTLTVENSSTTRNADISAERTAIAINIQNAVTSTSVIKTLQGSIIETLGVPLDPGNAVIEDISNIGVAVSSIINIQNDGTLRNLGTGLNASVFRSGGKSSNIEILNSPNGLMQAGNTAVAIDLTNSNGAITSFTNQGKIIASGNSAVISTGNIITSFINTGEITGIGGVNPTLQFIGQATNVNLQGGTVNSGSENGNAINTAGNINISGGSVIGQMNTTGAINIFVGNGNQFTTQGASISTGNLNLISGKLNLRHNVSAANLVVNPGAILAANNARTINGLLTSTNSNSTIELDLTSTTLFGSLTSTANADVGTSKIVVTNNGNGYIANDTKFAIIKAPGIVTTGGNPTFELPTSALYSFSTPVIGASDITTTITRRPLSNFGQGFIRLYVNGVASMLEAIGPTTTDAQVLNALGAIGRLKTEIEVIDALRQLSPSTNKMELQPAVSNHHQTMDILSLRLSKGYNAGEENYEQAIWAQAFGRYDKQNLRKLIPGYKSQTAGLVLGSDVKVFEDTRMGLAFSAASSHTKSQTMPKNQGHLKSYLLSAYGAYEMDCAFVEGMLGIAALRHKGIRRIVIPTLSATARNKHHGHEILARIGYGKTYRNNLGWHVTPTVFTHYSKVSERDYDEFGAGGLNLRVQNHHAIVWSAGSRLKMTYAIDTVNGLFMPEFRAGAVFDIVSTQDKLDAAFIPTGLNYQVRGLNPSKIGGELGLGFHLKTTEKIDISFQYDANMKSDYFSQNGNVTLRYQL